MSDKILRQDVLDELDFEPSVNSANIGVAVADGVVTLSGHVGSYAEKIAAKAAVSRVRGVAAIADEIEVRYPSDKKTADDQIAQRALDILKWSALIPSGTVLVTVRDGWVTLSGELEWQYQRKAAEEAVRKLTGVAGVINHVMIKSRIQPTDVKVKIETALKRNAEIEAKGVGVRVLGDGTIKLEGKVDTWHERQLIEDAAWSAPGVSTVDDQISVG